MEKSMAFDFKNWNTADWSELNAQTQMAVIAELADYLKANTSVTVVFTKLNGEVRTLNCTLNDAILGPGRALTESEIQELNETTTTPTPGTSLSVWDVDNSAWRSFRFDRVISIT